MQNKIFLRCFVQRSLYSRCRPLQLLQWRRFCMHATTPLTTYQALIRSGSLRPDSNQEKVINDLQNLFEQLTKYQAPTLPDEPESDMPVGSFAFNESDSTPNETNEDSNKGGFFSRLFASGSSDSNNRRKKAAKQVTRKRESSDEIVTYKNVKTPHGLYIHGTTGTGKTMLMDIFYESINNNNIPKSRVHFNKFMLDVHNQIHEWRESLKESGLSPKERQSFDPMPALSLKIAKNSRVLCFDEFQVTDIVDALLLNRLFTSLFYYGVIVVATSNRHPDLLYLNGLQRNQVFVPFLEMFLKKMKVIDLNSIDYRDTGTHLKNIYFEPSNDQNMIDNFENAWKRLLTDSKESEKTIDVMAGRSLKCPRCIGNSKATRFLFGDLCAKNLGTADYHALSSNFSTIFIENIPIFNMENRNEMKRFILLIDELYNNKNRVVCLAEKEPELLLNLVKSDENKTDDGKNKNKKNVFEEIFQFDRCVSRLQEMQSKEYLDDFHSFWRTDESHTES